MASSQTSSGGVVTASHPSQLVDLLHQTDEHPVVLATRRESTSSIGRSTMTLGTRWGNPREVVVRRSANQWNFIAASAPGVIRLTAHEVSVSRGGAKSWPRR